METGVLCRVMVRHAERDDDAQNPLYAESNCVFLGNSPNWSCVRPVIKTGDC